MRTLFESILDANITNDIEQKVTRGVQTWQKYEKVFNAIRDILVKYRYRARRMVNPTTYSSGRTQSYTFISSQSKFRKDYDVIINELLKGCFDGIKCSVRQGDLTNGGSSWEIFVSGIPMKVKLVRYGGTRQIPEIKIESEDESILVHIEALKNELK